MITSDQSNIKVNALQVTRGTWTREMTESTSLANAALTHPHILDMMCWMAGAKFFTSFLLQGTNRVSETFMPVKNVEYEHKIMGHLSKAITIIGITNPIPSDQPGLGLQEFSMILDDRLAIGEVMLTECGLLIRVTREPQSAGVGFVHSFQIMGNDVTAFMTPFECRVGARLGFGTNAFEEGSVGGSSKFAHPFTLRNQLTTSRWKTKITGSAASDVLIVNSTYKDSKGGTKKGSMWMQVAQWQAFLQWQRLLEFTRLYGKYNKLADGRIMTKGLNGLPVRMGAGILDQYSPFNTSYYSTLTEEFLGDFITQLQINSRDMEGTHFVIQTGTGGLRMFHNAFRDALKSAAVITDPIFVGIKGQELSYGKYFTTYRGILGTTLTVYYNAMQDDSTLFTRMHPQYNLPVESFNMYFHNFGKVEGQDNIRLVKKEGNGVDRGMVGWYTDGAISPDGAPESSGIDLMMNAARRRSHDGDFYELNFLTEQGVNVAHPMSGAKLLCMV